MITQLTEARQQAKDAQQQIIKARKQMAGSIRQALEEGLAPIFEAYPFLGSIAWSQYTPYFNDGDPCVFSSSFTYPSLNSLTDIENDSEALYGDDSGEDFANKASEITYGDYNRVLRSYDKSPNPDYDPAYVECEKAVNELMKTIAGDEKRDWASPTPTDFDQALMMLFGDHATVIVTREGIIVDECQHD